MRSQQSLHRRLLAGVIAASMALVPTSVAGAATEDATGIEQDDVSELIALVLAELGLPEDAARPVVDDLIGGVAQRLNELVEHGLVDPEDVDHLVEIVQAGTFDDVVPEIVEQTRVRRDAFRQASELVLAELGVDIPEGGSLRDAIREAGLTRDELAKLLEESGVELPAAPERPDRTDCASDAATCPEPPAERPVERPAPAPTTTSSPPPPPQPVEEPTPAPTYPEVAPQPTPSYPTQGGQQSPPPREERPERPPQASYPAAGGEQPENQAEEAL